MRRSHGEHLARYGEIDIALDPFPYNGGCTTAQSLWMGVPVVLLAGEGFAARMGTSVLTTVGLPELVADSREAYVETAVELARDIERLAEMRAGLRERVERSPLCDAQRFTRNLEAGDREMWRTWCSTS